MCIQSNLTQAEAETHAARERAKKQLEEARRLTDLKDTDKELPPQLQHVCHVILHSIPQSFSTFSLKWNPLEQL